ncbi:MAG: Asp/Glu racemase [Pseudomonadota bacterium]
MASVIAPLPWRAMACAQDDGPAARAAIGLIALASDCVIEPELRRFLPPDEGIGLYVNRIPMPRVANVETLGGMARDITETTRGLMPDDKLDVIAFGCTSGTMTIGAEGVAERIRAARPAVACSDPVSASLKGLRALGCRRIALLTPYVDEVNEVVGSYVAGQGFEIALKGSFKQAGDPEICRVPPNDIFRAGLELGSGEVDGLFVSCTALRVSPVLAELEAAIGKPVVASNQALAWDCLRQAGVTDPVEGFGALMRL